MPRCPLMAGERGTLVCLRLGTGWRRAVRGGLVLCTLGSVVAGWRTPLPRETTPSSIEPDVGALVVAVSDPAVRYDVDYAVAGITPDGVRAPEAKAVLASVVVRFWAPTRQYRGFDALVVVSGRVRFADPVLPFTRVVRTPTAVLTRYPDGMTYRHGPFGAYASLGCARSDGSRSRSCSSRDLPPGDADVQRFVGPPYLAPKDIDRKGRLWSAGVVAIAGPVVGRFGAPGSVESHVAFPAVGSPVPSDRTLPLVTSEPGRRWYLPPRTEVTVRAMTPVDDARYDITALRPAPRSTEGEPGGTRLRWVARSRVVPDYRVTDKVAQARFERAVRTAESRRDLWRGVMWTSIGAILGGLVSARAPDPAPPGPSPRGRRAGLRRKREQRKRRHRDRG